MWIQYKDIYELILVFLLQYLILKIEVYIQNIAIDLSRWIETMKKNILLKMYFKATSTQRFPWVVTIIHFFDSNIFLNIIIFIS